MKFPSLGLLSFPKRQWQYFDWALFLAVLATTAFGLATLWGSTYQVARLDYLAGRQALWWAVGVVVMSVCLLINVEALKNLSLPIYIFALVLLVFVLVQGLRIKGATSWIRLPGGLRFQPAEFAKVATILYLAQDLARVKLAEMQPLPLLRYLIKIGVICALPMGLIVVQPDLGTAVVFIPSVLLLLYLAGLRVRYLLLGFCFIGVVGAAYYPFLKDYQKQRLIIHWNPESDPRRRGYNIIQAKTALGSGQLTGKGWGRGTQSSLGFLPEHHADFIFNSLGEQFGLLGCMALLGLYGFLLARGLRQAFLARSYFGVYLAGGLLAIFVSHILLNVAIAVQFLPVTGLPLPFFSAGGSFLVMNYAIFGIVLNIGMRRHHF
jgi:rod shape determining protein RodA